MKKRMDKNTEPELLRQKSGLSFIPSLRGKTSFFQWSSFGSINHFRAGGMLRSS